MTTNILEGLCEDKVAVDYGFIESASATRVALSQSLIVTSVRSALASELITFADIEQFVNIIMAELRKGERFEHDTALCILAVALETVHGDFPDRFLTGLACVNVAELRRPAAVARCCLQARSRIAKNLFSTIAPDRALPTRALRVTTELSPAGNTQAENYAIA